MAMGKRKRHAKQSSMWVATQDLLSGAASRSRITVSPSTRARQAVYTAYRLIKAGMSGSELAATVIHEGVHVQDRAAFIATIDIPKNDWRQSLNITGRQSEINAYGVENLY